MVVECPFNEDMRDQLAAQEAGGKITFKGNNNIVFQFKNQESYELFKKIRRLKYERSR